MGQYQLRPVSVEAARFNGDPLFGLSDIRYVDGVEENPYLVITQSDGGLLFADLGDWVLRTKDDDYAVVPDPIFSVLYVPVSPHPTDAR